MMIIILLGMAALVYQVANNNILALGRVLENAALLQGQLPVITADSYGGICFDYLIAFLFNVNVKDVGTYFLIFGGR